VTCHEIFVIFYFIVVIDHYNNCLY